MAVEEESLGSVLVLCTQNAVRSPMTEALLKKAFGTRVYVQSAGVEGSEVSPFAVTVMDEIGLDISNHSSRAYHDLPPDSYDMIIALSQPAYDLAHAIAKEQAASVEYWEAPDPPSLGAKGSRNQILEAYRRVRDDLILHIENRFDVDIRFDTH